MSDGRRHVDIVAQRLAEFETDVRRIAHQLARTLPASISVDDLEQVGRIGAWQALCRHDGRTAWRAYAGARARGAMLDYLRSTYPGGRNAQPMEFVGDDALDQIAAPDDHARDIERAQQLNARIKQIPAKHRVAAKRILDGDTVKAVAESAGVSESRVSQKLAEAASHLRVVNPRVSASFDPSSVQIHMGSMPKPIARVNKYGQLAARMPATGSVVLHPAAAEVLRQTFKQLRVPYMTDAKKHQGLVEVWREPSPEQRAAAKKRGKN